MDPIPWTPSATQAALADSNKTPVSTCSTFSVLPFHDSFIPFVAFSLKLSFSHRFDIFSEYSVFSSLVFLSHAAAICLDVFSLYFSSAQSCFFRSRYNSLTSGRFIRSFIFFVAFLLDSSLLIRAIDFAPQPSAYSGFCHVFFFASDTLFLNSGESCISLKISAIRSLYCGFSHLSFDNLLWHSLHF